MAIVSDRKMIYERKIAELQTQLTEVSPAQTCQRITCSFTISLLSYMCEMHQLSAFKSEIRSVFK